MYINVRLVNEGSIGGKNSFDFFFDVSCDRLTELSRDVLQRHQAVHERDLTEGKTSQRRVKERAVQACEACANAKLSCDNDRPCKVRICFLGPTIFEFSGLIPSSDAERSRSNASHAHQQGLVETANESPTKFLYLFLRRKAHEIK